MGFATLGWHSSALHPRSGDPGVIDPRHDAVLLINSGVVFWLLRSSSLSSFVLERAVVTYGMTALAIFLSITRFIAVMRRDGISVAGADAPCGRPFLTLD